MKFLVDANLPPKLVGWLRACGHEAQHVEDLNFLTATDSRIWEAAKAAEFVVVSKDFDFYDRAILFGAPPQVLHFDLGNTSNKKLLEILGSAWKEIEEALLGGSRLVSLKADPLGGKPILVVF